MQIRHWTLRKHRKTPGNPPLYNAFMSWQAHCADLPIVGERRVGTQDGAVDVMQLHGVLMQMPWMECLIYRHSPRSADCQLGSKRRPGSHAESAVLGRIACIAVKGEICYECAKCQGQLNGTEEAQQPRCVPLT